MFAAGYSIQILFGCPMTAWYRLEIELPPSQKVMIHEAAEMCNRNTVADNSSSDHGNRKVKIKH